MSHIGAGEGHLTIHEVDDELYASWRCRSGTMFDLLKNDFRATFGGWRGGHYDGDARAWVVPPRQRERLAQWADSWFTDAAQSWQAERDDTWGAGQRQQRQQQEPPPTADPPRSTLDEAYGILHLRPSAPLRVVEAAYRALAKQTHPDAGGSHEAQKAINSAVVLIRDAQARKTTV